MAHWLTNQRVCNLLRAAFLLIWVTKIGHISTQVHLWWTEMRKLLNTIFLQSERRLLKVKYMNSVLTGRGPCYWFNRYLHLNRRSIRKKEKTYTNWGSLKFAILSVRIKQIRTGLKNHVSHSSWSDSAALLYGICFWRRTLYSSTEIDLMKRIQLFSNFAVKWKNLMARLHQRWKKIWLKYSLHSKKWKIWETILETHLDRKMIESCNACLF